MLCAEICPIRKESLSQMGKDDEYKVQGLSHAMREGDKQ